jgi:hypothetical protein
VDLPQTLHGQLYLLAFDRDQHRFDGDNLWLFGLALRAAMMTDLYLTGYLEDKGGKAHRLSDVRPDDPVLCAAFEQIHGIDWAQLIAENQSKAPHVVRDQLQATGWLHVQRRRMLGLIPSTRVALYDKDMVSGLAHRVTEALRNAIDGRPADPRPLAVGLLGVLGQMPTVFSFEECARHRQELRELTLAAIAPIVGLHEAIQTYLESKRIRNTQV